MNQEYEFDTLPEKDVQQQTVSEKAAPFVPREPDPSAWQVDGVKFAVTRGEQIFIHMVAGFMGVLLVLLVIFYAATAKNWVAPSEDASRDQVESGDTDAGKKPTPVLPDTANHPFADGKKGNVLYGNASQVQSVDLSSLWMPARLFLN